MSQEQAMEFIEKMKNDEAFREEVQKRDDGDAKLEYVIQKGITFTSNELMFAAYSALVND
ncbi:MAG: Nif11-like leader peptide family natural product precursor [Chlorobiales bacterium]|nr:Nif11-like leader peptide family natural product precursor [Chlorobiales bacterium]